MGKTGLIDFLVDWFSGLCFRCFLWLSGSTEEEYLDRVEAFARIDEAKYVRSPEEAKHRVEELYLQLYSRR